MTIGSNLFRSNQRLVACEVQDAAHVKPGDRGEYVRLIQIALNVIENAGLVEDGDYGPATARAVLAYKKKRAIINRSYQSTVDNIVGKMTIASLDTEMRDRQYIPTPDGSKSCPRPLGTGNPLARIKATPKRS